MSDQELTAKVEELKKKLNDAAAAVEEWEPGKKDDASVTMSYQSLSALYESGITLKV